MAVTKKTKCTTEGCKKTCVSGWPYCEDHKPFDPVEDVARLTVAESERWGRLDAEIRNALLGARVKQLEIQIAEYEEEKRRKAHKDLQASRQNEIGLLQQQVNNLKNTYQAFTEELAGKYKVDKTKMVIDPDTRVIREAG